MISTHEAAGREAAITAIACECAGEAMKAGKGATIAPKDLEEADDEELDEEEEDEDADSRYKSSLCYH